MALPARKHYKEDAKKDIGADEIMSVELQKVMFKITWFEENNILYVVGCFQWIVCSGWS